MALVAVWSPLRKVGFAVKLLPPLLPPVPVAVVSPTLPPKPPAPPVPLPPWAVSVGLTVMVGLEVAAELPPAPP
ncbi:MAG: hypothetical protein H6924_03760 [Alphaproteobacteria bacterium]|nr:hypothetical protein [Alphaproteobacteria bacterium]